MTAPLPHAQGLADRIRDERRLRLQAAAAERARDAAQAARQAATGRRSNEEQEER